uniref:Metalloendopeptidase n=1 Tax=Angiostrongylus cantonensis TaxID=6313 RepID=A0A0K0DH08_ANGCA
MRALLITILAAHTGAGIFYSSETTSEGITSEKSFEEKLNEGNKLLKNQPHEHDTLRLLEHLHNMETEIKGRLINSSELNAESINEIECYVEAKNSHIQAIDDTIEEINRKSKVDMALFQGDMILTKEQAGEIIENVKNNESDRKKRQAVRDFRYPKSIWSKGVNYAFWNASNEAMRVFRKAAALWSEDTCIDFVENNTAVERIDVIRSDGCFSYVGKIGRTQSFSLGEGCESIGTASHELGHALGFARTQSRHDRDSFITLLPENFLDGWMTEFVKEAEHSNYNYNLTYDYGSIIHYSAGNVSKNGQPTMVPRLPKYLKTLGSRIISFYDKLMMNLHYGCLGNKKLSNLHLATFSIVN